MEGKNEPCLGVLLVAIEISKATDGTGDGFEAYTGLIQARLSVVRSMRDSWVKAAKCRL